MVAATSSALPAPHTSFRFAGSAHDLIGTDAIRAQQDNLSPPDVLMRRITIPRERGQAAAISGLESDGNSRSHPPDSHVSSPPGGGRGRGSYPKLRQST